MGKYFVEITSNAQKDLQKHYKSGNKSVIKKIEKILFQLTEHTFFRRRKAGTTKARLSRLLVEKIKSERPNYISC